MKELRLGTDHIVYRPTVVARLARLVLPSLQRVLPFGLYKVLYGVLYTLYKILLRYMYLLKMATVFLFGSDSNRKKVSLTWRLLPYTMGGRKALENAYDLVMACEKNDIKGALVECGVAQGGTAGMMAVANIVLGRNEREKWFFDSYEGLPEPTVEDYKNGRTGEFIRPLPKGSCLGTYEQVSSLMFDQLGLRKDKTHLIKGWFQDTLPVYKNKVGNIAILRLDGDWYESTREPLINLYEQVVVGGYVIVDDYATCFGSRRAVDEFLSEKGIDCKLNEDGRGGVWFKKSK